MPPRALIAIAATLIPIWLSVLPGTSGQSITAATSTAHICQIIARSLSPVSEVFYPGSDAYNQDVSHAIVSSSINSTCSVEPGSTQDVGKILQILGSARTPFAVKGGGHATNVNFSSTVGVQIAMSRFSQVDYHSESQSAVLGAGLIWDEVYAALDPLGVVVPGGRVSGIGVAGFTLGGGFTWKTNQLGLALDNVLQYELVLPSGRAINVTEQSYPDLFFGLRGGYTNFGIVTRFTFKAVPQGQVWGGSISWSADKLDAVSAALVKFNTNVKDPKAGIIQFYGSDGTSVSGGALLFYDAPSPAPGIFDDFLAIPSTFQNITIRSYGDLVNSFIQPPISRGLYSTVSFPTISSTFTSALVNQSAVLGPPLGNASLFSLSFSVEPFLPTMFEHNATPSAWPPSRSQAISPLSISAFWTSPDADTTMHDAMRQCTDVLQSVVDGGDQNDAIWLYPNYALADTPLEAMYGSNVERIRAIKESVDPEDVMGLAGGFKF